MSKLSSEIISQKQDRFNNLQEKRLLWDKLEYLFHGYLNDSLSNSSKSQVSDPRLASLIIERAFRVMAQLGIGKVTGISSNDMGDARLKNLLLEKYVIPNANSQFDMLTKFRMVDMYSNLYGSFDVLVDNNIKANGYVGPDMWLLNKRDVFIPNGAISINDSDDVIIRTWRTKSFFESLRKRDGYKNIPQLLTLLEKKKGSKSSRDSDSKDKREENEYTDSSTDGYYEIITRFEKDRWVDVCADVDIEFRDINNPHEDDVLPVIRKYSLPLVSDAEGMGDGQRGASMQMVQNSVWNMYLDGVKTSLFPPLLVNKDNIASMSSLKWGAAQKWLVRNQISNAVQPINLTPQGIQTFNNTLQASNASLLNIFGTTDTTVTQQQDVGFGKTPQALQMQQARELTRDAADKFFMERFVEQVMRKMVNLLNKKQTGNVQIRMFPEEMDQIAKEYPEVRENYSEETGKLTIPRGKKNIMYDYEIVSGSTYALDQEAQQKNMQMLLDLYRNSQTPNGNTLVNDLKQAGYNFNFGELFKRIVSESGIKEWDKILQQMTEGEKGEMMMNQDSQIFQQVLQQMQMGGQVNQVPAMPEQQLPEMGQQLPDMGQQMI